MDKEVKVIVTEDGSHSLFLPELNETYHSTHGALTESKHVFIQAGLEFFHSNYPEKPLRILEIGFGTGLNALLALQYANSQKKQVHFTSLEPYPLSPEVIAKLNYGKADHEQFLELHQADWETPVRMGSYFTLEKRLTRLEEYDTSDCFDLVFFDAFAPSKQSELWEYDILEKTVGYMAPSAVLVTYCAKGQFKRDLAALGLTVETLPGPPGKKEMVRAVTK